MSEGRYISTHFTEAENRCRCGDCNKYSADIELVAVLEELREELGRRAINVTSWFRCRAHNNRPTSVVNAQGIPGAGSNDNSWHLVGGAVDFWVRGIDPELIGRKLRKKYPNKYGIGIYDWGVHLDIRPVRADWNFKKTTGL